MISKTSKKERPVVPLSKQIPEKLFKEIQKSIPVSCVDLLPVRKAEDGDIEVLLIKRKIYPEQGKWGLIGGRILKGELTKEVIRRQAKVELGVSVKILPPWTETNPFAVFNDPVADEQKHFVVLTYLVHITKGRVRKKGPEFNNSKWLPLNKPPKPIMFHHKKVLDMVRQYSKTKSFFL